MSGNDIIFLDKVTIPKMWGSEDWVVSAHPSGLCTIKNRKFAGKTLKWLWENEKELFGNIEDDVFPLLTKVIVANDDLSIQVHPDDAYAQEHESSLGKTECWYIIDCEDEAEIILGHSAKNKEEVIEKIRLGQWNELLNRVKIKPGDFFHIPAGTVHGIGKGTVILETQQSSDVTYRLYDYDRLEKGSPRELHIKDSIEVITAPHRPFNRNGSIEKLGNARIELLVKDKYFTVSKMDVYGKFAMVSDKPFQIVSVLKGEGFIGDIAVNAGDNFILPNTCKEIELTGKLELMISHI